MNNSFSFVRLWQYAKAEFMCQRRRVLLSILAVTGVLILIQFFAHFISFSGFSPVEDDPFFYSLSARGSLIGARVASGIVIVIAMIVNASRSFRQYFNKGCANSTMMMPVSRSEKFTFALVLNHLLIPFSLISLMLFFDYGWAKYYGELPIIPELMSWNAFEMRFIMMMFVGIIGSISYFFLGAVFFRRHQLLFTILAIYVIQMIIAFTILAIDAAGLLEPISIWLWETLTNLSGGDTELRDKLAVYAIMAYMVVQSIVLCIFAWLRYRKLQITK